MANFQKIKAIAKEKGVSLGSISQQVGITPTGLSLLMRNNVTSTDTLESIARVLGVSVSVFFDDTTEPMSPSGDLGDIIAQKNEIIKQKDDIISQLNEIIRALHVQ